MPDSTSQRPPPTSDRHAEIARMVAPAATIRHSWISKIWYGVKRRLLGVFGDLKVFKWPMFIVYSPTDFYIKGEDTLAIMGMLQPGDILLRRFISYLDGYFIPGTFYSHGGIYIGEHQMIHAVAEGVRCESIIDFVRADAVLILRPMVDDEIKDRAVRRARGFEQLDLGYDFNFDSRDHNLYCFELCALCYFELEFPRVSRRKFGIRTPLVYLDDSFLDHPTLQVIYEKRFCKMPVKKAAL